ncbi:MAG: SDR family oxidoreductase [Desulfofustis sp.]|jgi:3-oxoacyl-[acyl-carrier protein] reductase
MTAGPAVDQEKLALVTGAAGVLGLAISTTLVGAGYRVVMIDVDHEKLGRHAENLGAAALPMGLDLSRPEAIKAAAGEIRERHGDVSVLVNNAGLLSNNKVAETTDSEWRQLLAVNLDAAFYLCREWLGSMKRRGWGRIVNISSLAMKTGGLTAGTSYTTSKGGLTALTLSVAREAAPFGVTANGVAPAYIKTPMITDFLDQDQQRALLDQIPVGRFCEAEEVAHVVSFLVSPLSGFITGEIIDINGGLHMD